VDTQYRIGSITKTMTAVLIMQLRDEGLLDLADPVGAYLPGIGYGDRNLVCACPDPTAFAEQDGQ
jgi:CubicO group peptidase (beta-lactamase class C family)